MIEILIPTFNRAKDLEKNLDLLVKQINKYNLNEKVLISISDNASEGETASIVQKFVDVNSVHINFYQQKENIGLERNAVFLLEKSVKDFVMYLGDDDFIPNDYLPYLIEKIKSIDKLTCIIPGYSALYADGTIKPGRRADFNEKIYEPSFQTVMRISQFGHQLSGLLLRRESLYESYIANEQLRNIYLFIYFVTFNNLRGISIYAPKFQVLVSQNNSKDWAYDDSGLLTEIFKNYKLAFQHSYLKRNIMNFLFMHQQSWRLRIETNMINACKSFMNIEKNDHVDLLTKLLLPLYYMYLYSRQILSKIKKLY